MKFDAGNSANVVPYIGTWIETLVAAAKSGGEKSYLI